MGAQDEYLRNFCILLTSKGAVPLTDPLQITVYQSLLKGMKRPSDLAAELNLSSSSLHFIIDKMVESGIIDRTKSEHDKKTVYYSTKARILACSADTDDARRDECTRNFTDPLKNYNGLGSLSNMLDCYASEIGLNMEYLKESYAEALADCIDIQKAGMEDAVLEIRDVFTKLTGFTFTVYSFSPLTLVVKGDNDIMKRSPPMMRFIAKMIENATGRWYNTTGIEPFNGSEDMVKVTMERAEKPESEYINTTLHHLDKDRFLVVDLDGNAGLMTSEIQMQIVDAVYERPLCITDIVNSVDFPRSTITSNLLRMVEEGVISVFYSESGSAYYGLACSILFKKVREMSSDAAEIYETLESVKDKENAYMEGQLLYILAYLRKLGFDSHYIMVVLGAKYMRASGSLDVREDFDTYFGKMSDVAKTIGLSLSIVSVYPLTIGISNTDPEIQMSQAMTFITGMAHQGLEMASSGIFVRSTESRQSDENVSFKEIYPALSMNPIKGIKVENLAPAPTANKRTSSVKTALLNRSKKDNGKPARTVRYITSAAFMLALAGMLFLGFANPNTSELNADTFSLYIGDDLDATITDSYGNELTYPYGSIESGQVLTLTLSEPKDIGLITDGYAYLMEPTDGKYVLTMDSNKFIEELVDISALENGKCDFFIEVSDTNVVKPSDYKDMTGGLFVSKKTDVRVVPYSDFAIQIGDAGFEGSLNNYTFTPQVCNDVTFISKPVQMKKVILDNVFIYGGQRVDGGIIEVDGKVSSIELRWAKDTYVTVKANGVPVELDCDKRFILELPVNGDVVITSEEERLLA